MRRAKPALHLAVMAGVATLLSGCVAAALPVIAAGGLVSTRADDRPERAQPQPRVALPAETPDASVAVVAGPSGVATVRQATFSDGSTVTVTNMLPRAVAASSAERARIAALPGQSPATTAPAVVDSAAVRLTDLRALPPPSGAAAPQAGVAAAGEYDVFADYAAAQAAIPAAGSERRSAILADSTTMQATTRECSIHPAAVLIDLDPANGTFDTDRREVGDPILADRLAALREEGVTIGWVSSRTADRAGAVRKALQASGLDPEGRDELVLLRFPEERKQTRRDDFARAYCVVAMAGDERADFDELFAYLRDPVAALPLEKLVGQGWFIVPPPIQ